MIKSKELSSQSKEQFIAIFYRSAYTKNMLREIAYLQDNAKKVKTNKVPINTPMYFFISDGKEVPGADWRVMLSHYVMQAEIGRYKYLDCGHYVHHEKSDTIANEMKAFVARMERG